MSENINDLLKTKLWDVEDSEENVDYKVSLNFLKRIGVLDDNLNCCKDLTPSLIRNKVLEFLKDSGVLDENLNVSKEVVESNEALLRGLVRDNPRTPEGKYLVLRRDGSVVEFPVFVLGARDPYAEKALRYYADLIEKNINNHTAKPAYTYYPKALHRWADEFKKYREEHGDSNPCADKVNRVDCPLVVTLMKQGKSA